jgi:pilus assembly protein CpaE
VLLSFENVAKAVETVKGVETHVPDLQIIAINRSCDPSLLRETMRVGVRELVSEPFEISAVLEALRAAKKLIDKKPPAYALTEKIFSFVPSKAGVGTTTLAVNIAAALTRGDEGSVLLSDLDLNSGLIRFLLQLKNEHSLTDAIESVARMNETIWPNLIASKAGMDVLHAGRVNPSLRVDPPQMHNLVLFARRNYRALVFDHSGSLERYSLDVMQQSKKVLLVCTPEISSLHLAREKMTFLKTLGLDAKVSVLLNRVNKRPLFTATQVEELVGAKVIYSLSNDYYAVNKATRAGQCLDATSAIGRQCAEVANALVARPRVQQDRRKKFLEFFNVSTQEAVAAE